MTPAALSSLKADLLDMRLVPRVFFRSDCFYIVELAADDDLNEHARLNPGTLRIENIMGEVLWPEGSEQ